MASEKDILAEQVRAEDILLGSLGFDSDASIITVKATREGYKGIASWSDGEEFEFESDDGREELEDWAIDVILKAKKG